MSLSGSKVGNSIFFLLAALVLSRWLQSSAFPCSSTPSRSRLLTLLSSRSTNSWQEKNPLQQLFLRNGGIIYKTSIFAPKDLALIQAEASTLVLRHETSSTVARNRVGAVLPRDSNTVRLLGQQGSILDLVHKVCGPTYVLSGEVPVEVRVYEKKGSGMEWHVDDVLYDPPQVEVVLTLENTSDCQTVWKHRDSLNRIETEVNSAILLQAGGVEHFVSSLKQGRRVILKCAYIDSQGAIFDERQMVNQFGKASKSKHKRKS